VSNTRSHPRRASRRAARRLALSAIFEADFGQRTALAVLERHLCEAELDEETASYARELVQAVLRHRSALDARIESVAPAYPVVQLARIDRALLRTAMGELLHCRSTPAPVVMSEWVSLARTYSGEPARRLINGVLGRVASQEKQIGSADADGGQGVAG
jgi:N utilization substance protein B